MSGLVIITLVISGVAVLAAIVLTWRQLRRDVHRHVERRNSRRRRRTGDTTSRATDE